MGCLEASWGRVALGGAGLAWKDAKAGRKAELLQVMLGEWAPEVQARVSGRRKRGTRMGHLTFYSGGPLLELSIYCELEFT